MPIEGTMINNKFVGRDGTVYASVPKEAVILEMVDTSGNGNTSKTPPQNKDFTPANQLNGAPGARTTPRPGNKPYPTGHHSKPKPETEREPETKPEPEPEPDNLIYPKCISIEIIKAIQTPSMAQVTVRAHCKNQFADAVVHHDFEVYEQIYGADPEIKNPSAILNFKKTALMAAQAEAVQIAKTLLTESEIKAQ